MGSWPGPAAAAPLLTAMLQLLLKPQVAKRREERKGGRREPEGRPQKVENHCSAAAGEGGPRGPVRDPQSPLAQTPLARAT